MVIFILLYLFWVNKTKLIYYLPYCSCGSHFIAFHFRRWIQEL